MLNLYLMYVVLVLFGDQEVFMALKKCYVMELKCR